MDPNAALQSLLCGHMVLDHYEALRDWMRGGGFAPDINIPCDLSPYFALGEHGPELTATADRWGIHFVNKENDAESSFSWHTIARDIKNGTLADWEG